MQTEVYAQEPKANTIGSCQSMNIVTIAYEMAQAVETLIQKARKFFFSVMLLGYRCPNCNGSLVMLAESRCRCTSCQMELDPTVRFERCLNCGGVPELRVCRYQCRDCGADIRSRFVFSGLAFDSDYFRQKVAESRQRKKEQRERVKQMLAETRTAALPLDMADLNSVPGLLEAINGLTAELADDFAVESRDEFDLKCYETHIQAHIDDFPLSLVQIPPLHENARKDLIWRFIAVIFLAHIGVVDIWQEGQDVMVVKHEVNGKG